MPFVQTIDLASRELVPGFTARFIHTNNVTLGYVTIAAGSILPEHSHMHEQVTHVLEGKLELTIDGEKNIVEPGRVAVIPSGAKHSAVALTDCKALDVFQPVREDYK
jgi:quercetin dioxygenase-like cupin family protein